MRNIFQKSVSFIKKAVLVSIATSFTMGSVVHATPKEVFSDRYAAIVIDANSGKTLFDANANAHRYPASLTKMMTLYLLFEALKSGRVTPNTPIPVSAHAASRPPTKIGFKPGETIPVEAAAKALITKSANDVAVAIAEYLGGSEENFAQLMTNKAHQLGMMNTHFANASGLPDVNNYSTARDLATLSLALRDHFPLKYKWFKTISFRFKGRHIRTHNHLVTNMKGVDGIKTGYTHMSGANLASSIRIAGKSVVAVVMGGKSARLRDTHMVELLHRYLPKASKHKSRPLLFASANYTFKPASYTPVPLVKATEVQQNESMQLASNLYSNANPDVKIPKPTFKSQPGLHNSIITALMGEDNVQENPANHAISSILVADNRSLFANPFTNEDKKTDDIDSGTPKIQNWAVQIGSLRSAKQANALLNKAKKLAPYALNKAKAYTKSFKKGKSHFYRARFSFLSKDNATKACIALRKSKLSCYIVAIQ